MVPSLFLLEENKERFVFVRPRLQQDGIRDSGVDQ